MHDLRIDKDDLFVLLIGIGREIQNEESKRQPNLVGRQSDSPGFVHQVKHRSDRCGKSSSIWLTGRDSYQSARVGILDNVKHAARSLSVTHASII